MELLLDEFESEIGSLILFVHEHSMCTLGFADGRDRMTAALESRFGSVTLLDTPDPCGFTTRLRAYLDGQLDALDPIPVNPGGTPFQQKVWSALREIPVGTTCSYAQLATAIGHPTALRAVGMANNRNPIGLVIPCHRVIGADRSLTGYAGSLHRKRWLLEHEGVAFDGDRVQRVVPVAEGQQASPKHSVELRTPARPTSVGDLTISR